MNPLKETTKYVVTPIHHIVDRVWWLGGAVKRSEAIAITDISKPFDWLAYDWRKKALTAQFASGSRYRYDGVPPRTARELFTAHSKGKVFNKKIRNVFPAWKMV